MLHLISASAVVRANTRLLAFTRPGRLEAPRRSMTAIQTLHRSREAGTSFVALAT